MKQSKFARFLMVATILAGLAACGGDEDGDNMASAPPLSNPGSSSGGGAVADLDAMAAAASLSAALDTSSNLITLGWKDMFPAGTVFDVQVAGPDGSFTTIAQIAGSDGAGSVLQWQGAATVTSTYRVLAQRPTTAIPLRTAASAASITVEVPLADPSIDITAGEPLSGSTQLTIRDAGAFASVKWFVDLNAIGEGASVTWNTGSVPNGAHLVVARIQKDANSYQDIKRNVEVNNSTLAVSASVVGTTGTINLDVRASSAAGIRTVSATLDGRSLGQLTELNACRTGCIGRNDVYRFPIDAAATGSGNHTAAVTATDNAGGSEMVTAAVPIDNRPVLTISTPVDGAVVSGVLKLVGIVTSDKAGAVNVVASLGDAKFLDTTQSRFSADFNVGGLSPGPYTLTVRAADATTTTVVQRSITVASSNALAYDPLFTMGKGGELLAADPGHLVYTIGGVVSLRNATTGSEVALSGAKSIKAVEVNDGRVYQGAGGADCPSGTCVYEWSEGGIRTNLSAAARGSVGGSSSLRDDHPVAKGRYVMWASTAGTSRGNLYLFDAVDRSFRIIPQPSNVKFLGNTDYDFLARGSLVDLYFWATTSDAGVNSLYDVFRWKSDTAEFTQFTDGTAKNFYPETDDDYVVWRNQAPGTSSVSPFAIKAKPVDGGPTTELSAQAYKLVTGDGITAWGEHPSGQPIILRAQYRGVQSTVATASDLRLHGTGGGFVVYSRQGKTYSWQAATGTSKLILEDVPLVAIVAGNYVYMTRGAEGAVYRIRLD